jgi:3-methyladenine DNA glycosylase AlkD
MNLQEAMAELEALGTDKQRNFNIKKGYAGDNQFGLKMGDIRNVAKKIKSDHALALQLWNTGNFDARLLATLILKPGDLSEEELDGMVRSIEFSPSEDYSQLADWLNSYVVKAHPKRESLRQKWMRDDHPMAARAGWSLTASRLEKDAEGLEVGSLLDRIEAEMKDAAAPAKWTMNYALATIGISHPEHRSRAIGVGEKLGVYRDFPTPKGCTSPFAPIWIDAMVNR